MSGGESTPLGLKDPDYDPHTVHENDNSMIPRRPSQDGSTLGNFLDERIKEAQRMTPRLEYIMKAQDMDLNGIMDPGGSMVARMLDIDSPTPSLPDGAAPHAHAPRALSLAASIRAAEGGAGAPSPLSARRQPQEGSGESDSPADKEAAAHRLAESEAFLERVKGLSSAIKDKGEGAGPAPETVPKPNPGLAAGGSGGISADRVLPPPLAVSVESSSSSVGSGSLAAAVAAMLAGTPLATSKSVDDKGILTASFYAYDPAAEQPNKAATPGGGADEVKPRQLFVSSPAAVAARAGQGPYARRKSESWGDGPESSSLAPPRASASGSGSIKSRPASRSISPGPRHPSAAARRPGSSLEGPPPPGPAASSSAPEPYVPASAPPCQNCKDLKSRIDDLSVRVRNLTNESQTARRGLKDATAERKRLAAELSDSQERAQSMQQVLERVKSQFSAHKHAASEAQTAKAQLAESQLELRLVKQRMDLVAEENGKLRAAALGLTGQVAELQRELDVVPETHTPIRQVEDTLRAVGRRLAETERARLELEEELAARRRAEAEAGGTLSEVRAERDSLRAQLEEARGKGAGESDVATRSAPGIATPPSTPIPSVDEVRMGELEARVAQAVTREAQLLSDKASLETRLAAALQSLSAESAASSALRAEGDQARRALSDMESRLGAAERRSAELSLTLAAADANVSELRDELTAARGELSSERVRHEAVLGERTRDLAALEAEVGDFKAKLQTFIERMAAAEAAHSEARLLHQEEATALSEMVRAREEEAAALRAEVASIREESASGLIEVEASRRQLAEALSRAAEAESQASEMAAAATALRSERESLVASRDGSREAAAKAERALAESRVEVDTLKRRLEEALDKIDLHSMLWDGVTAARDSGSQADAEAGGASAAELAVARAELDSARRVISDLQARLEDKERAIAFRHSQKQVVGLEASELRRALRDAEVACEDLRSQVLSHHSALEVAAKDYRALAKENAKLRAELARVSMHHAQPGAAAGTAAGRSGNGPSVLQSPSVSILSPLALEDRFERQHAMADLTISSDSSAGPTPRWAAKRQPGQQQHPAPPPEPARVGSAASGAARSVSSPTPKLHLQLDSTSATNNGPRYSEQGGGPGSPPSEELPSIGSVVLKASILIAFGMGPFFARQEPLQRAFFAVAGPVYAAVLRDPVWAASLAMGALLQAAGLWAHSARSQAGGHGSTVLPQLFRALVVGASLSGALVLASELVGPGVRTSATLAIVYPLVAAADLVWTGSGPRSAKAKSH